MEFVFDSRVSFSNTGKRSTAVDENLLDIQYIIVTTFFRQLTINLTVGESVMEPLLKRFKLRWKDDIS